MAVYIIVHIVWENVVKTSLAFRPLHASGVLNAWRMQQVPHESTNCCISPESRHVAWLLPPVEISTMIFTYLYCIACICLPINSHENKIAYCKTVGHKSQVSLPICSCVTGVLGDERCWRLCPWRTWHLQNLTGGCLCLGDWHGVFLNVCAPLQLMRSSILVRENSSASQRAHSLRQCIQHVATQSSPFLVGYLWFVEPMASQICHSSIDICMDGSTLGYSKMYGPCQANRVPPGRCMQQVRAHGYTRIQRRGLRAVSDW